MKNYSLISHRDSTELVYQDNNHITGVSYIPLDKGESIIKPHLSHHFVVFVLKGKVEMSCKDFKDKIVNEGHMTFLSKGGFLKVCAHDVNSSLLFFGFDEVTVRTSETLMNFLTAHGNLKGHSHNTLPVKADMKQIVDRIVTQLRRGRMKHPIICQAWNTELFITFISYYTESQITEFFRPIISTDINFRDFIENNYVEVDGNVEKLIKFSGMPAHVFGKKFKEMFGTTPKVWMTERFKQDLKFYASQPNATTSFVASKLRITDVRLCQLTKKFYNRTPQQIIESLRDSQTLYSQARP